LFTEPQTVTINAVPNSLNRIPAGPNTGILQKDDGNLKLSISHSYGNRTRRVARIDHRTIVSDPLNPTQNKPYNAAVYLVIDLPANGAGYTVTTSKQIVDGFTAWLTASSGANVTKVLGGES